jgi:hypothetical protein
MLNRLNLIIIFQNKSISHNLYILVYNIKYFIESNDLFGETVKPKVLKKIMLFEKNEMTSADVSKKWRISIREVDNCFESLKLLQLGLINNCVSTNHRTVNIFKKINPQEIKKRPVLLNSLQRIGLRYDEYQDVYFSNDKNSRFDALQDDGYV